MGSLRFRRSIRLLPGVKLNINRQSVSLTAGVRGAHATINSKGYRTLSAGIPGTGLSYRDTKKVGQKTVAAPKAIPAAPAVHPDDANWHEIWESKVNGAELLILMTMVGGFPSYFLYAKDAAAEWQFVGSWWDIMTVTTQGLNWETYLRNGGSVAEWLAQWQRDVS